jgi:hypothetical protein
MMDLTGEQGLWTAGNLELECHSWHFCLKYPCCPIT